MLARRGKLILPDGKPLETPLLLPSFSSRGFPDVKGIMKSLGEVIRGPALISAYDVGHEFITKRSLSCIYPAIFIDSGGYECLNSSEIIGHDKIKFQIKPWGASRCLATMKDLLQLKGVHKVVIAYDFLGPITVQVSLANRFFLQLEKVKKDFIKGMLIKSLHKSKPVIDVDDIVNNITIFNSFSIIGVTEKELGVSLLERLENLQRIRKALDANGMNQFIHVFGALDTITTPLFFFAGADIFDGLTWLRYGYLRGLTVYQPNFWMQNHSIDKDDYYSRLTTYISNYNALQELALQMRAFTSNHDFSVFDTQDGLVKRSELFQRILGKVS